VEEIITATDMVDLKRDMQQAKINAWLQKNKQLLVALAVVGLLVLLGSSVWKEQQLAHKNAAALLYLQAINETETAERTALLDAVTQDYADTGYATLAQLQKIRGADMQTKESVLKELIAGKGAPELVWQARLDLAELYLAEGRHEDVQDVLGQHFGAHYEQVRYYLLSRVAVDDKKKSELIQKSLDAEVTDNELAATLESELALLRVAQ